MTDIAVTDFLFKHSVCYAGHKFALKFSTMSQVWDACERPDWLLWIVERSTPLTKEQAVRVAIAAAESCIHLVPDGDKQPRKAIDAAKHWLKEPTYANSQAAYAAAADAAWSAADADAAARAAAWAADAAWSAADAARDATRYGARRKICDMIRSIVPNPFLP